MRLLIAVDGSAPAERAVKHVAALAADGMALHAVVLNVQPEWAPARSKEDAAEGKRLHAQAAERAVRGARAMLQAAKLSHEVRMRVGPAAENIVKAARASRCHGIVMGARGRGAIARVVLGSVSLKTLQLADVPVTIVR
jgi:nucleotide-binding universal stress UspA family protein